MRKMRSHRWPEAQKKEILAELEGGLESLSEVAGRHGLAPGLLLGWRRQLRKQGADIAPRKKYEHGDQDIIDYQYQIVEGCSFAVRGPVSENAEIACLGSAATFGRFVEEPYSVHLARLLGTTVTNLGFGGARFETFLREPAILEICRNSKIVILEFMSARSFQSELFTPRDHLGRHGKIGQQYFAQFAKTMQRPRREFIADDIYKWALEHLQKEELANIRRSLLKSYEDAAVELICEIGRPVVMLWFSQREMDQTPAFASFGDWCCGFPHFVDLETANQIGKKAAGIVNVTSSAGIPQQLRPRDTADEAGKRTENYYYPSPEMHREAADKLSRFILDLGLPLTC